MIVASRKAEPQIANRTARRHTIAKVIDVHGGDVNYRDDLPLRDADRTAKVMSLIPMCRTGALGGCSWQCRDCSSSQLVLKSCGDRHCPTCSAASRHRWHEQLLSWAIGCDYLHQVVTVPHELNDLIAANPEQLLRLLASESRQASLKLFRSRYGCLPGLVQVIHTWGQRLNYHFHVHTVLTAGGLSFDENGKIGQQSTRWVDVDLDDAETRKEELAASFKTLFLRGLRRLWKHGELRLPTSLSDASALEAVLKTVQNKDWIADIEGTPPEYRGQDENQHVFGYLAKYVAGVAIGDSRLISVSDEAVVFDAKDYRDKTHVKVAMPPGEFCWWFSRHILPHGMSRTRYAGCYAPAVRRKYLALCRKLWKDAHPEPIDPVQMEANFLPEESAPEEPHDYRCKKCDGLVDPGDQIDGALTVSLLAAAQWVVAWQQEQVALTKSVPHWRKALAEVIRQRVSTACRSDNLINSIRSGLIRPDAHWLGLFEQAIELVTEEKGLLEPTTRPP